LLVEVQALVSPSPLATPRRAVVGWDAGRLAMVLAVLEARCGLALAGKEVYLNVAGGLRIGEPAADLAVAAALVSAATDRPVPPETVVFGEIGLSGEIRAVSQVEMRLKEAAKLGFTGALTPPRPDGQGKARAARGRDGLEVREVAHLQDLVRLFTEGRVRPLER
jgi:DNA repair protein RadA/Sms